MFGFASTNLGFDCVSSKGVISHWISGSIVGFIFKGRKLDFSLGAASCRATKQNRTAIEPSNNEENPPELGIGERVLFFVPFKIFIKFSL